MTSRLKRKLNDLGVDTASTKANENFCLIGTPLPPFEKSKDKGEFVPLWKQEVRDEKGRRRLHGAFTGGFSAGYFNTVGSKEGWAPSTFVSSRSDRAKQKAARPEDFMDEEDLAELRDSKKLVDENEEMDFGGTASELKKRNNDLDEQEDSMASALARSLAPPPQDSSGAKILRKMGWRMGHGIGPRLTYAQRRAQDVAYGFPPTTGEPEDDEATKHMYPRRDTPLLLIPKKENAHGLGYKPGMGLMESLGSKGEATAKGPNISSGFGLGALNDADEDDLDVYDMGHGPRGQSRVAYEDEDDDHRMSIASSRSRRQKAAKSNEPAEVPTAHLFRDGRPVLKGFVASIQPVVQDQWFPLPDIPKGWSPNPRGIWELEKNKENLNETEVPRPDPNQTQAHAQWKKNQLSADKRGSILGETPLPSKTRSVFEFLSQKDRERLQNIRTSLPTSSPPVPPGPGTTPTADLPPPPPHRETGQIHIPHIHPSVAKAALQGFQPFATDPVKQSRYTSFLNYASQASSDPSQIGIGPTPGQTVEDFNKELADYVKSATVFKPLSAAMAGRFRTAVVVEMGPKVVEGLHTPDHASTPEPDESKLKEEKKEEDPKAAAVRLGMYGPLTREVKPWQPAKLLCKRFGVKDPEVEISADGPPEEAQGAQEDIPVPEAPKSTLAITDGKGDDDSRDSPKPRDLANIGLGEDETQGRDTLTYVRPSMDVFKAIFASDDEESDEEDEGGKDDEPEAGPSVPATTTKTEVSSTPAHLGATTSTPSSYVPNQNGGPTTSTVPEVVDISTFKPTFVPRSDRKTKEKKDKDKEKSKKKKSKSALVSFGDEEEGALEVRVAAPRKEKHKDKDGERKKKKRKEKNAEEEDDGMWVEKPPPEVVQTLPPVPPVDVQPPSEETGTGRSAGPPRGRKRAIDFM